MKNSIGTIVKLINSDKLIMIIGYKYANPNKNYKIEDYIGVEYPIGLTEINNKYLFSLEDIDKTIFRGYKKENKKISNKYEFDENGILNKVNILNKYEFDNNGIIINYNNA